ncbi:hypothetical protein GIY11_11670 [Aerococcaceae bacterium DSM 109653]|uniref:Uncharacterized protein n=1 Tax=Fundicoccus ignavus TaxID=2664442 RepID=A0A844BYF6_9LACT|nr:hypothetical protein [Fundicoccus ignavus]MRI82669.1 hypothetical protein [Fundicoccus ignavus]
MMAVEESILILQSCFHSLVKEFIFGGNPIFIGEEENRRVGLSDYQSESIQNKNIITIGSAGKLGGQMYKVTTFIW